MQKETIDVIFRKFRGDGSLIALFPSIPADSCFGHCLSYQRMGQHGVASVDLSHCTVKPKPEEIAPLVGELKQIGYRLRIVSRRTHRHDDARRKSLHR